MISWSDESIILDNRKYNENSNIITIFSRNYGLYNSILKYAFSQSNRSVFQIGNIVKIDWQAKLAEQMGSLKGEIEKNIASEIFNSRIGIFVIGSASYILKNCLVERQIEKAIYQKLYDLLINIKDFEIIKKKYLKLEEVIIGNSGYAIDYSKCSVTGSRDDLYYLSPKTGKAVTKEVGDPYADKLFILPKFMTNPRLKPTKEDYVNAFKITGYFIEKYILAMKNLSLPPARQIILELV